MQAAGHQVAEIRRRLQTGIEYQDAGRFDLAWECYRGVLELSPEQADALNLLGVIACEMRNFGVGVDLIQRAIRQNERIPEFHLNLGNGYLRAGEPARAISSLLRALQLRPEMAEAHLQLGLAHLAQGTTADAIACLQRAHELQPGMRTAPPLVDALLAAGREHEAVAVAHNLVGHTPESAEAHYNLGNALFAAGSFDGADKAYQHAIALRPDFAQALTNLARLKRLQGESDAALALYRKAVSADPALAEAHVGLGIVLRERGDRQGALEAYRAAISARPDFAAAFFNLGNLQREMGQVDEAIETYQNCLRLDETMVLCWVNLGNALRARKRLAEAMQCYQKALAVDALCFEAQLNVGNILRDLDRVDEAQQAYRRAMEMRPDSADAHNNLGVVLKEDGWLGAALDECVRAIELAPAHADAHYNLGTVFVAGGECAQGMERYRQALSFDPNHFEARSGLLMALNYGEGAEVGRVVEAHREFERCHASDLKAAVPARRRGAAKLRIGYVSADLRRHSVAHFAEPLLSRHDKSRFEVVCYHNHVRSDEVTGRFKGYADQWVECVALSDEELAARIRADGIDVLVDLGGHTAGNRLLVFARKPAPVQMTWLGYPTTTGLSAIDYRITDWQVDPDGYERHNTEKPLRLPSSYFCYRPPQESPEVGELPALGNGDITFGSFNNLAKVSEATVALWSRVLEAIPDAKLLMKTKALADETVRLRTFERFAAHGIERARLELIGWEAQTASHLAIYNRVDIALDTWPYNGATTTCEALWMGVPVITLGGPAHASRMGASILCAAGLPAFVVDDGDRYVAVCRGLAGDIASISDLRRSLRFTLQKSALMDERGFASAYEHGLREAWRNDDAS